MPGKITKNGDEFALPLLLPVHALVSSAGLRQPLDAVFQLTDTGKPFTAWTSFTRQVRRLSSVPDFNFHHLRRTFNTVLAEQGIGTPEVVDGLLNHRQTSTRAGVKGIYNQASLWPQKQRVMAQWAELVDRAAATGSWHGTTSEDDDEQEVVSEEQ